MLEFLFLEGRLTKEKIDKYLIKHYNQITKKDMCIIAAFMADLDINTGKSKEIDINDLIALHKNYKTNNGRQWLRNFKINGKMVIHKTNGNKIWFDGYKEEYHNIPSFVKENLKGSCVISGSKSVEIDHKNGRYTNPNLDIANFQLLNKSLNNLKREICKNCKDTNCRPSARSQGFNFDYLTGGMQFKDDCLNNCSSCYWGNIEIFNKLVGLKENLLIISTDNEYEYIISDIIDLFEKIINIKAHNTNDFSDILKDFSKKESEHIKNIAKNTSQKEADAVDREVKNYMYKIWGISLITYKICM